MLVRFSLVGGDRSKNLRNVIHVGRGYMLWENKKPSRVRGLGVQGGTGGYSVTILNVFQARTNLVLDTN